MIAKLLIGGARHVVVAILLIAGVSKALDVNAFLESLETWTLLAAWLRPAVALLLPPIEVAVALSWFWARDRRVHDVAVATVLMGATAAYAAHLVFLAPPTCNCFGQWLAFDNESEASTIIICRNAVMLQAISGGAWLRSAGRQSICWLIVFGGSVMLSSLVTLGALA